MKDYIVRGLVLENNVRVFGVNSTLSCKKGCRDHNCSPLAGIAFGRVISAGIMMGAMLIHMSSHRSSISTLFH